MHRPSNRETRRCTRRRAESTCPPPPPADTSSWGAHEPDAPAARSKWPARWNQSARLEGPEADGRDDGRVSCRRGAKSTQHRRDAGGAELPHQHAAVDLDRLAGEIGAVVAGEK